MKERTQEKTIRVISGWTMLLVILVIALTAIALIIYFAVSSTGDNGTTGSNLTALIFGILLGIIALVSLGGFFTLQPNESKVLVLFGNYVGTVRHSGFHWTNPFNSKYSLSLRARNFNTPTLKVNDKQGNPIEIGSVIVWRVSQTAQAQFDVDCYEEFVEVQSEAALRHLASNYAYDHGEEGETTLRCGLEEVSAALKEAVQQRLTKAGVEVEEARISYLAYAAEIAGAMLKRQQAEAIIAARQKIVHGAVSMVEMALKELEAGKIINLDEEKKANMVSNLLVILCSESDAQPVVNAGTAAVN